MKILNDLNEIIQEAFTLFLAIIALAAFLAVLYALPINELIKLSIICVTIVFLLAKNNMVYYFNPNYFACFFY